MKAVVACVILTLLGCGSSKIQDVSEKKKPAAQQDQNADATSTGSNKKSTNKKKERLNPKQTDKDESNSQKNSQGDDSDPGENPQTDPNEDPTAPPEETDEPAASSGASFFAKTLMPMFTGDCATCHADPRMNPPQRGPLSIFSYDAMLPLLNDGNSAANNRLMRKVRGEETHGGGNRCTSGATASPCKEIAEWWQLEHGIASGFDGRISSVSVMGDVVGYAVDTRDESITVTARLFVDGQLSVETIADKTGSDGNYSGDHAFRVALPASVRDGKEHTLTLQVGDVVVGSPLKFTAYAPKDNGRTYFMNTVQPALDRACRRCHAIQYEVQYSALLTPAPNKGGTATNNSLINSAAGENHPGGNVCGGKNGNPCDLFQTWWTTEFGP